MKTKLKWTVLTAFSLGLLVFLPHGKTTLKSGLRQMESSAHVLQHVHRSPSSLVEYPAFLITATCAVRCNGEAVQNLTSEKSRFDPEDSPFGRVNGLLPPR